MEQMIREEILLLITKELTEQASEDEKDMLKDWLSESRENTSLYHSFKEAFLNGKYELKAKNKDEVYNKLSHRLRFEKYSTNAENNKKLIKHRQISPWWLKIAATVLVLITSSLIIYQTRNYWQSESEIPTLSHKVIIKSNPRGEKSLITLPDGSKVKLNSESHLEYYSDFENDRSVQLIGEAFFEVVKDTLRPFYVKTGDLRVRVLGTSFNVEAFPFEKNVKVALVKGKVLIEKKEGLEMKPIEYLNPDEMLIYDHQSSEFTITPFDFSRVTGWKDGELHFDETDFDVVIEKLERWYGVEILVSSKADLSGRFNGDYNGEPLDLVLEGMGFTSDFDFEIRGKKVYIK
jgi:transmembrane sensor